MEFLKQHYEKMLLAVLMVVFILSMFYLMGIIQETAEATRGGLKLEVPEPDFVTTVVKDETAANFPYKIEEKLEGLTVWHPSRMPRNERNKRFRFSSDLINIPAVSRCGHCERLIPLSFFGKGKCPFTDCDKALAAPPKEEVGSIVIGAKTKEDPDGCGIPHKLKQQLGLSTAEADRENVLDDLDGDGFSNLYEYRQQTELNNPKSHPELWHRLILVKIDKVPLPIIYKAINTQDNSPDQRRWMFQITNTADDRKSGFFRRNRSLDYRLEGVEYRVADEEIKDQKKIRLVPADDPKSPGLVLEMGKIVFAPDPKVFLKDIGTDFSFERYPDKSFRLGSAKTGFATYKVSKIDLAKNSVYLSRRVGKRWVEIKEPLTTHGMIKPSERIRQNSTPAPGSQDQE